MRFAAVLAALVLSAPAAALPPRNGLVVPGKSFGGVRLGDTAAQVRAAWGSAFGRCRNCAQPTWYFNYAKLKPQGASVVFRSGRVDALYTIWSPPGWHTNRFLLVGDQETRAAALYGPLPRSECDGYQALAIRRGATLTIVYVVGDKVWGFGLIRAGAPVCPA